MRIYSQEERVQHRLQRSMTGSPWDFSDLPDARDQRKITWPLHVVVMELALGQMRNEATLRDVERSVGGPLGSIVPDAKGGVSDTTLYRVAGQLDPQALVGHLEKQVRRMHRDKMLTPAGLPLGVVTVDGKCLGTLDHDAQGTAQANVNSTGKPYWLARALRGTLTSSVSKACVGQMSIPALGAETTTFPAFVEALHKAYGRIGLFEVVDVDAGFVSWSNMDHVNQLGYGYFGALKGNQPELLAEATRVLSQRADHEPAECETPWELRNGSWFRYRMWRTDKLTGWTTDGGTWSHLRQTLLVRQETLPVEHEPVKTARGERLKKRPRPPTVAETAAPGHKAGRQMGKHKLNSAPRTKPTEKVVEERFFITSILWNRLRAEQLVRLVRSHWGVENDTFHSLDVQWKEDATPWCTTGSAVWSLGILRLMAYNQVQYLRKRLLRERDGASGQSRPGRWRLVFELVRKALDVLGSLLIRRPLLGLQT